MPKYRGYVVANRGPKGRTAMRDSGKAHSTKAGAIADMKRDNSRSVSYTHLTLPTSDLV